VEGREREIEILISVFGVDRRCCTGSGVVGSIVRCAVSGPVGAAALVRRRRTRSLGQLRTGMEGEDEGSRVSPGSGVRVRAGSGDGNKKGLSFEGSRSPVESFKMDFDAFEAILKEKGIPQQIEATRNLIAVPLLIMAVIGVGFILVWAEEILVPFVIALFVTYLLKPLVNVLCQPWGSCTEAQCLNFFQPASCTRRSSSGSYASATPSRKDSSGEISASFDHINVAFGGEDEEDAEVQGSELEMSSLIDGHGAQVVGDLRSRGSGTRQAPAALTSSANASQNPVKSSGVCMRCRRFRCPRWLAILLCMLLVVGFFAGIVVMVADAIQTFEDEDIERFEERAVQIASSLKDWVAKVFGIDIASLLQEFRKGFHWVSLTQTLVFGVINALEYLFIIFLFVLYMLFEDSDSGVVSLENGRVSSAHLRARDLRRQIDAQIQRYIVIKTLISLAVGLSVYVVLGPLLHVKMAHIFGLATFLCNLVPTVGAMLATLLPIPMVLLDPDQTTISMILAIALPSLVHLLLGNVIEPMIFGHTLELHAVVILVSLSFWYTVWGVAGAILSVPITAVMRIVLSHINHPYAFVVLSLLEGKVPGSRSFHVQ